MTTEETIYNELLTNGIPPQLALLVVAQSKHETNGYTSNVFKTCNNAFGYKYVGQAIAKSCSQSPELDNYAGYSTVENSAKEMAFWIKRRQAQGIFPANLNEIQSASQYAMLLKNSGFYGDTVTNYTAGLLRWFKSNITIVSSGLGLIIAAVVVFF